MKRKWKRIMSGVLAAFTLVSAVLQPLGVSAAETEVKDTKPPLYEEVKDMLDADEVVTAADYELEVGSIFDAEADFSGIEIPDNEKVKVTFEEAKNAQGEDFSTSHADTYQAIYYVEPLKTEHPMYQISRNLVVKEAATEVQVEGTDGSSENGQNSENAEDAEKADADSEQPVAEIITEVFSAFAEEPEEQHEDTTEETPEETEDAEIPETENETVKESETNEREPETDLSDKELDAALEEAETEKQVDEETGLSVSDVLIQGAAQGIDVLSLDEGETVSFTAKAVSAARASSTSVSVTRGSYYYYADYGLGSYVTAPYTVKFGDITATAYCVQPSKAGPDDGTYTITKLSASRTLAKVCYYGTKASGDEGFFAEKYPDFSTGKRFIITHLAASYANGSSDAFSGTNATGQALAMELYDYCISQPDIPDVAMSFSDDNVTAYVDGDGQRTKEITFKADELQTITMKLPDGVKLHNVTTGNTSKAGEDVVISGGTTFYLSAPLNQASNGKATFSTTMKGSITKDYSAYKITTGSATQDLALVFGEGVDNEKYVSFSVQWVDLATVSISKKDFASGENLEGAVYGIYSDEACTKLIVQMPATDSKGASSVTFAKTQETVYLKEITAPKGYVVNASAKNVKLVSFTDVNQEVTDKEQLAQLTVYKTGEVLTGASVTENGVSFQYSNQKLSGAKYNVYAAENIVSPTGNLLYKKDALIAEGLTTDSSGKAVLAGLHLGSYKVTEAAAPENYVNTGESKTVTLSYAGQNVEIVFSEITFHNERQKAAVSVVKKDIDTEKPLSGGVYGLYADSDIKDVNGNVIVKKGTLIEKVTTGMDGSAAYHADLPINVSYFIKEEQAPNLYYRNQEDEYRFTFAYTNEEEATVSFSHLFVNDHVNAEISLVKKDAETGDVPQGDATLEGAVYGLYAREDIVHPDGKTGVLYKAETKIAELTTDENGKAKIEDLYLGKYYVKELKPSEGYLLDTKEYDLDCNYEGDLVETVKKEVLSPETVIKQPFQLIKAANNGETDADLLEGVGFSAYLISSLKTNSDGTYDFASAEPVVIGENGATEIFTDAKGHAVSIPLPYGEYIVRETTTPHNYKPVDDFVVRITENHPNEPQVWRVLLDDEFQAKLKITKKDDETKKTVLLANTEFKIYDLENEKYVEQVTTYPTTVTHTSFFTDEHGFLILPENLAIGKYRIEEVTAPNGYTLNTDYVEIEVDSNTAYHMDAISGDAVIEVEYENHPVKGELTIQKQGDVLASYDGEFHYEEKPLAGAEFEIFAAEDIYTADHQKDTEGNRLLEYAAGELVATVVTDESGKAVAENLPLGKYIIKEKTAPEGFVLSTEPQNVEFSYNGQDEPVVKREITIVDERQKVSISVVKKDAENGSGVSGAVFGIYNRDAIISGDAVLVEADTLLQEVTSGEDGKAVFSLDFPLGSYYVKELKAPAGYVSSDEVLDFDASYQGQDVKTVVLERDKKNEPTTVEITKSDLTTGIELDGASLSVLDQDGNIIDSWISERGKAHVLQRLEAGKTYILREEFAPYGYLKSTDVEFTIEDTAEIQKVEMKDDVPTALLLVNKKGEFLDKVTLLDNAKGTVEHFFEYITGNLSEVTFEVYAAEDVKAADGVSDDYYKADELVGTITTDEKGVARLEGLPVGKYYVKEIQTAHGYVLDGEPRYVDLSYRDQDTPVVTYQEEWQNNRQKAKVTVLKKEKGTERMLAGGIFGLYTKDEIVSASGNILMEADTLIELKTTDENGQITFAADLPIDGSYYVKELYAPDGFVTSDEAQEFVFEYADSEMAEATYTFTFENEPTTVEITKTDFTNSEEVLGAHLQVTDENGIVIDEWVSEDKPHVIRELIVGKEYTLTETLPADGYVTAESISFVVENTAEAQKVEMKDDRTKVEISKTDIAGSELPGAKLTILDEDEKVVESWTSTEEPHYIEMLPIGKYTLREELAPSGYLTAEDIAFEVMDTGEIQKVHMKDEVTKVEISKTDIAGAELPGAKLTILDENGKVVESWTSTEEPHYIEMLPIGKYTLREESAPEGYLVAEDVAFEVKETAEIQKVHMVDEAKPVEETPDTPQKTDTPKTGDDSHPGMWMVLLLAAGAGIGGSAFYLFRKKGKRES